MVLTKYLEIGALCLPVAVRFVKGVVMLSIIVNSFPYQKKIIIKYKYTVQIYIQSTCTTTFYIFPVFPLTALFPCDPDLHN